MQEVRVRYHKGLSMFHTLEERHAVVYVSGSKGDFTHCGVATN